MILISALLILILNQELWRLMYRGFFETAEQRELSAELSGYFVQWLDDFADNICAKSIGAELANSC